LLALRSEAFFADPVGITALVWRFLGLQTEPLQQLRVSNQGKDEANCVGAATRAWLQEQLDGERQVMEQWLTRLGPHGHLF
jgi:hypothetical protein